MMGENYPSLSETPPYLQTLKPASMLTGNKEVVP
jgi:hypothetical protein